MIVGNKGSGVTTQINMLCEKYKLESLNLKEEFLSILEKEKKVRRRQRQLEKGFKAPVFEDDEDGNKVQQPDPEIDDDPEDFDKEQNEKDLIRSVFSDPTQGLIIDGTWNNFTEEITGGGYVTAVEGGAFVNLLCDSRRPPEMVVILKCGDKQATTRMIDEKAIKTEFDRLMKVREDRIQKEFDEAKKQKETELQEELKANEELSEEDRNKQFADGMKEWEEAKKEEDPGEDDLPNYAEMKEKEQETLTEQRTNDNDYLDALVEALTEKNLPVIKEVKTDTSAQFIHLKLVDLLKNHFKQRNSLIERMLAQPLSVKELPFYE